MRLIITVGLCFLLFVVAVSSFHVIEPGTVGVKVTFGSVSDSVVKDGFNFVNPFSKVVRFSTLTENYIMSSTHDEGNKAGDDSITVLSSNGLSINMDISVPHKLCPEQAPWVLKNWGKDYEEKFVRQTIASSLSEVSSRYTDSEIYATKRLKFVEEVHKQIELDIHNLCKQKDGSFVDSPVIISQVLLKNVRLPAIVKAAIEKKLRVDQEAQEMDFTIAKTRKEAERKRIEAEGIAQFQKIVASGIDETFLKWKALEVTKELCESNNAKIIIMGTGNKELPVLFGALEASKEGKHENNIKKP